MSMLSIVIEKNLTIEEAGELTHLEDEATQAQDELYFARELEMKTYDHIQLQEAHEDVMNCVKLLDRAITKLNNYRLYTAKNVLARIPSYQ